MKAFFLHILLIAVSSHLPSASPIVKNEILIAKDDDHYLQVRHLVLKGSNESIGKALGDIAQNDYHAALVKYAKPLYGTARESYMKKTTLFFFRK